MPEPDIDQQIAQAKAEAFDAIRNWEISIQLKDQANQRVNELEAKKAQTAAKPKGSA